MPRVSQSRTLSQEERNRFLSDFDAAITSLPNKEVVTKILDALLTEDERIMLAKRLQIAMLQQAKWTFRDIDEYVKITQETIGRLSDSLRSEAIVKLAKRMLKAKEQAYQESQQIKEKLKTGFKKLREITKEVDSQPVRRRGVRLRISGETALALLAIEISARAIGSVRSKRKINNDKSSTKSK